MWTFYDLYCQWLCIVKLLSSLCENNVQVTKLCTKSILCNVPIVTTGAIISNAVARWRAMHVSRLQNAPSPCLLLYTKLTILWNFPVQFKKLNLCVSFKHEIDRQNNVLHISKTPAVFQAFSFHSPDGITCSGLHSATCRRFLTAPINTQNTENVHEGWRILLLWHEIEWHIPTRQYLVYDVQVLKLVIVTFSFSLWNVSFVIIKVRQNHCFFSD